MVVVNLDQSKYEQMERRGYQPVMRCAKKWREMDGALSLFPFRDYQTMKFFFACPHSAQPSIKQVEAPERGEALTFEMCTLAAKAVHRLNIA